MKPDSSPVWRQQGDKLAFEDGAWEFQARQFNSGARVLLAHFEAGRAVPSSETLMALPTAQYLLALSLEMVGKAYYLRAKLGAREGVYTHAVSELIADRLLSSDQKQILVGAEELVVWAGRYPTPKWTKEVFKEKYDVPVNVTAGIEHIDANAIQNTATPQRCRDFLSLFEFIHGAWRAA